MHTTKKLLLLFMFLCKGLVVVQAENMVDKKITIHIAEKEYTVSLENKNETTDVFSKLPLNLDMKEWSGNNEYYCAFENKILIKQDSSVKQFEQGDVALYNGRALVIFYADTKNTQGYIKLGHIENLKNGELKLLLKNANGKVMFTEDKSTYEKEVYAAYETINNAMIKKDRATMERYFDKNLIFTHMSGKKQTREEFIGEIMDGTLNYFKVETKDYTIRVEDDTAYMSVTHTLTAKVYGINGAWTLTGTSMYKKRDGIWVRVNNND